MRQGGRCLLFDLGLGLPVCRLVYGHLDDFVPGRDDDGAHGRVVRACGGVVDGPVAVEAETVLVTGFCQIIYSSKVLETM